MERIRWCLLSPSLLCVLCSLRVFRFVSFRLVPFVCVVSVLCMCVLMPLTVASFYCRYMSNVVVLEGLRVFPAVPFLDKKWQR